MRYNEQTMEEDEYKQAYHTLNQTPCAFEKAILSGRCHCAYCQRLNIAEREAVMCQAQAAAVPCAALLAQLRQNATFALKLTHLEGPLPHAKEMKVQCGGLLGLQAVLFPEKAAEQVDNIHALIQHAIQVFGDLEHLPYQTIVQSIHHYQVRSSRR
ncbi:MAG: hypothetical protein SVR94_01310 [Pseudomonadota bacterium]|nr:hypothetical protein [Pseudomonadota bacterium]